ncbi:hypothetical protein L3X38_012057 [Prunus dulcis]|uniref:Retrovirus-related Pol polyprotein from transposon TNT 1-94-like beta-barrel domain-containing protein n=1 Tax=Prunus dulcis TaxID=3755 RepID=A0AAD4WIK4_PRUDU|nr:hypothetical protein L3X38_012057 [Prunus dulcis]
MASSVGRESRTPIFSGENYELWRIRMKTILRLYGIWELVEEGVVVPDPKGKTKEIKTLDKFALSELLKQDAKALDLIQGVVSDELFSKISKEVTAKGAWDLLQQEYRGDERVRRFVSTMKVFEQRRERHFENIIEKTFANKVKCNRCSTFGHIARNWSSNIQNKARPVAHFAENQTSRTTNMFYASHSLSKPTDLGAWYIDSGCSNHMTAHKSLLSNTDRSLKCKVKMGIGE